MNTTLLNIVPTTEIPSVVESVPSDLSKVYEVCQELERLCRAENGLGIAATQAGVPWNVFLIRFDNEYRYFVECNYQPLGLRFVMGVEGCLSLKKDDGTCRLFDVERFAKIRVTGKQLLKVDGELRLVEIKKTVEGAYAPVWQHEIDHGRLVLISDVGTERR